MGAGSARRSGESPGRKPHLGKTLNDGYSSDRQKVGEGEEVPAKEIAFAKVNARKTGVCLAEKLPCWSEGGSSQATRRGRCCRGGVGSET